MSKWVRVSIHIVEEFLVEVNDAQTEKWAEKKVIDKKYLERGAYDSIDSEIEKYPSLNAFNDNNIIRITDS